MDRLKKITIDGFGGDSSPDCIVKGVKEAVLAYNDIEIDIVGQRQKIIKSAQKMDIDTKYFNIVDAKETIKTDDDPTKIREIEDSSMAVGLKRVRKGLSDAFVSAGNTGALTVGASTIVGRIKGIKRAALSPVMPSKKGCFMLIDAGANLNCRSDMLTQFAVMGSVYMNKIMGIKSPRVALANVGTEPSKGTEELIKTNRSIKKLKFINFLGNIEARDIPLGECDVVVSDGFNGNMILKTMEGTCIFFIDMLKDMFFASTKTKIAALLMKKGVKKLKDKMDYTEYGGAILLGINKPIIKAHGSSDANAIKNAINIARKCIVENIVDEIKFNLNQIGEDVYNEQ